MVGWLAYCVQAGEIVGATIVKRILVRKEAKNDHIIWTKQRNL